MAVVVCITWIPFQDDFVFSVAVHIAYRSVVGAVCIGVSRRGHTIVRSVERYFQIACRCVCGQSVTSVFVSGLLSIHHGAHLVGGRLAVGVGIVITGGGGYRSLVHLGAVAIDVEARSYRVGGQVTPRQGHGGSVLADGNDASSQVFTLQLVEVISGLCRKSGCQYAGSQAKPMFVHVGSVVL